MAKKLISLTAFVSLSLLLITVVSAGPNDKATVPNEKNGSQESGQNARITPPGESEESPVLKTPQDKANYAIGVNLIGNLRQQGIDIDLNFVIKGMKDASSGGKLLMSDEEIRTAISLYQAEVRRKQAQNRAVATERNKKEGEDFLAENKKKDGIVTLPSGLQYRIIKMGDGKKPTDDDTVECLYRGTLLDGTEFDSSERTGHPATFKVAGVIPGWKEALTLMPVGSKWQLFIPPQLAYGERGARGRIGPNATLIFEVELLAIK